MADVQPPERAEHKHLSAMEGLLHGQQKGRADCHAGKPRQTREDHQKARRSVHDAIADAEREEG